MTNIGKPYEGKPHVRFDEEGLNFFSPLLQHAGRGLCLFRRSFVKILDILDSGFSYFFARTIVNGGGLFYNRRKLHPYVDKPEGPCLQGEKPLFAVLFLLMRGVSGGGLLMRKHMVKWGILLSVLVGIGSWSWGQPARGAERASFSDIEGHWAKEAIVVAVGKGYVRGYPDGTFKPDANVSRAEFLAIVTRASKLADAGAIEQFDDVASNHWAVDAINKGIGMGFLNPSDYGNTFEPNKALTRAEMVKWLVSGLAKADASFVDALRDTRETILPFTEYFPGKFKEADIPYIAVSRGTGLVGGFPDGSFGPDRTTTRAEVVVLLERYLGVEGTKADAYKSLNEMREVGTTGTNLVTIGNVMGSLKWIINGKGEESPIFKFFNQDLIVKRNIGIMQVNRILVFDPGMTSVYTNMFLDEWMQETVRTSGHYFLLSEVTATFSWDVGYSAFAESTDVTGSSVMPELPNKYGYQAIRVSGGNPMFKKGVTSRFWSNRAAGFGSHVMISTTDNKTGGFVIEKE